LTNLHLQFCTCIIIHEGICHIEWVGWYFAKFLQDLASLARPRPGRQPAPAAPAAGSLRPPRGCRMTHPGRSLRPVDEWPTGLQVLTATIHSGCSSCATNSQNKLIFLTILKHNDKMLVFSFFFVLAFVLLLLDPGQQSAHGPPVRRRRCGPCSGCWCPPAQSHNLPRFLIHWKSVLPHSVSPFLSRKGNADFELENITVIIHSLLWRPLNSVFHFNSVEYIVYCDRVFTQGEASGGA